MSRILSTLGEASWGKRASAVFVLCAAAAMELPGQTLTTIYSFCSQTDCAEGELPVGGWSKPPMGTSTEQRTRAELISMACLRGRSSR
jgi:hypothetical protein